MIIACSRNGFKFSGLEAWSWCSYALCQCPEDVGKFPIQLPLSNRRWQTDSCLSYCRQRSIATAGTYSKTESQNEAFAAETKFYNESSSRVSYFPQAFFEHGEDLGLLECHVINRYSISLPSHLVGRSMTTFPVKPLLI